MITVVNVKRRDLWKQEDMAQGPCTRLYVLTVEREGAHMSVLLGAMDQQSFATSQGSISLWPVIFLAALLPDLSGRIRTAMPIIVARLGRYSRQIDWADQ